MASTRWRHIACRAVAVAVLILVAAMPTFLAPSTSAAGSQSLHGAGLVIRHGNGKIVYVYVEFEGNQISGAELLSRSGLPIKISPVPGLGEEVCEIQQEGCPPSNCYCKSYASPAYYWHYYRLDPSGNWVYQQSGPTTSIVHDGDVDGWAWTSDKPDLPKTNIDQIALLNGVHRAARPAVTATPVKPELATGTAASSALVRATPTRVSGSPAALAVEGSDHGGVKPLQTKPVAGSNSPGPVQLAEIALATAVLVGVAALVALRRRGASR